MIPDQLVQLVMKTIADKAAERGKERWTERRARKNQGVLRHSLYAGELRKLELCDCDCPEWDKCARPDA